MRSSIVSRRGRALGLAFACLALASCGGGGGGGSSAPPTPGSKLFITDGGNHAIASIVNAAPTLNSTFTVDRIVTGAATGLGTTGGTPSISSIPSIALDAANDRLFAATQGSVAVFDNASTASGNVPFSRSLTATVITDGVTLRGVNFYGLSLDTANNRLYSVDPSGEVHVFNSASSLSGLKTPDRTVTPNAGPAIIGTFGVAVDSVKDKLYVGAFPNAAPAFIMVFDGAASVNTNTMPNNSRAPDRVITVQGAGAFHLDQANDCLYVSRFDGLVWVFNNASTLTGAPTPDRTIDLTGGLATIQFYIFVDTSRDKLYAVGNVPGVTAATDQGIVLIVDKASTANDVPPNGPNASDGLGTNIVLSNIRLSAVAVKP